MAQTSITHKQWRTFETREEFVASTGTQDTDSSGYELSDLDDIDFFRKNPQ